MNRIFEHVGVVKHILCKKLFGTDFEQMAMNQLTISEILFADDTLLFAAPGHSSDALVWAIEAVSAVNGLKLNRGKCAKLSLKPVSEN